jgi:hypothetical protein
MAEASRSRHRLIGEGITSAISVGWFFVLIGVIVVTNHNLWSNIVDFFHTFTVVNLANSSIRLPIPAVPAAHVEVYTAAFQFALGIAILQVIILALRLIIGSRMIRTAETIGNLVFWFGAVYLLNVLVGIDNTLAVAKQQQMWLQFWALIIVLIGVSMVVRSAALFIGRRLRGST